MNMDREKRLVLEDSRGLKTYFYRDPSAFDDSAGDVFRENFWERGDFAVRRNRRKAFFNSSLFGFAGAAGSSAESLAHPRAAAAYTVLLARVMGCREKSSLVLLERGALFHDIGKAGLPAEILDKAGALTPIEREIMMEHPVIGHRILRDIGFFKESAGIVLHHHERFDGRGYPFGLAGDEIPEGARIFALADTLDAITSDRPYRKGRGFPEAVREIAMAGGSQFDPRIVDAFLSVPADLWAETGREARAAVRRPSVN